MMSFVNFDDYRYQQLANFTKQPENQNADSIKKFLDESGLSIQSNRLSALEVGTNTLNLGLEGITTDAPPLSIHSFASPTAGAFAFQDQVEPLSNVYEELAENRKKINDLINVVAEHENEKDDLKEEVHLLKNKISKLERIRKRKPVTSKLENQIKDLREDFHQGMEEIIPDPEFIEDIHSIADFLRRAEAERG